MRETENVNIINSFNSPLFVCNVVGVADFVGSSLALTNRLTIPNFLTHGVVQN